MRAVSRDKRKFKGIMFDLYKEYKTKEAADKKARELRDKKTLLVRVVRDYYWRDSNPVYYLYTRPIEKSVNTVNFFDNLFDGTY